MPEPDSEPSCRVLLVRPRGMDPEHWDTLVRNLRLASDSEFTLMGILDPEPSPDILIVAGMEGFPVYRKREEIREPFTHIVQEKGAPDIPGPDGRPSPRIPFGLLSSLSRQFSGRARLMTLFTRYRSFAQSLTDLIPIDRPFHYEILICQSLRDLLYAEAVVYCEARIESREVSVLASDPEGVLGNDPAFSLSEAVRTILFARDRYFDDIDPRKVGLPHLPSAPGGRVTVFKLERSPAANIPFLLILPRPEPEDNSIPENEFQNALEISAPVLETSHALFEHSMFLKLKSEQDSLTKILNRESLDTFLHFAWKNAELQKEPLSALMIDIDHFKKVNDAFGHHTGDLVLLEVTRTIAQTLRSNDGFGRYGGEEFVVFLPGLDRARAVAVAERIRQAVERKVHPVGGAVTISIGVATFPDDLSEEKQLLPLADRMMYQAKRSGRNRVASRHLSG